MGSNYGDSPCKQEVVLPWTHLLWSSPNLALVKARVNPKHSITIIMWFAQNTNTNIKSTCFANTSTNSCHTLGPFGIKLLQWKLEICKCGTHAELAWSCKAKRCADKPAQLQQTFWKTETSLDYNILGRTMHHHQKNKSGTISAM